MLRPSNISVLEDLGRQDTRTVDELTLSQILSVVKNEIKIRLKNKVDSIHFQDDPFFNFRDGFRFSVRKNGKCFVSPVIDLYSDLITTDVKKVKKSKFSEFFCGVEYVYDCSGFIKNIINLHCDSVEEKLIEYGLY